MLNNLASDLVSEVLNIKSHIVISDSLFGLQYKITQLTEDVEC